LRTSGRSGRAAAGANAKHSVRVDSECPQERNGTTQTGGRQRDLHAALINRSRSEEVSNVRTDITNQWAPTVHGDYSSLLTVILALSAVIKRSVVKTRERERCMEKLSTSGHPRRITG
jgi:hypothetical protein